LTVHTPAAVVLKVVEHFDVSDALAASAHELGTNVPLGAVLLKVTTPAGGVRMPDAMSCTVAVQVVEAPAWNDAGTQLTVVFVVRSAAVTVVCPWLEP
jgi:hypothetical protein